MSDPNAASSTAASSIWASSTPSSVSTNTILPPFESLSSTNQSGVVVIITLLLLSFVVLCFLARVYTRIYINGPWLRDDNVLTAATVTCCVESALICVQVHVGFGQSIDLLMDDQIALIGKIACAIDLLYITGLTLSKCSIGFLFLRLSPNQGHSIASWAAIMGSILWAVMSIFLLTIECNPGHPFSNLTVQCSGLILRWKLIGAFDIITESLLFSVAIYVVAKLNTSMKKKATVVMAFGLRLPIIAAAALHLYYLARDYSLSNTTLKSALVAVWTQVELDYSVMAGTLLCLGPFMAPFSTSYREKRTPYGSLQRSENSYGLTSRRRSDKCASRTESSAMSVPRVDEPVFRQDNCSHAATVSHDVRQDQLSIASTDSRQMIIKKNIGWSVVRD